MYNSRKHHIVYNLIQLNWTKNNLGANFPRRQNGCFNYFFSAKLYFAEKRLHKQMYKLGTNEAPFAQ